MYNVYKAVSRMYNNVKQYHACTMCIKQYHACTLCVCVYCRYSVDTPGINMTLWSSRKTENMKSNIIGAYLPLTSKEKLAIKYIRDNHVWHIQCRHWEDKLKNYHSYWTM